MSAKNAKAAKMTAADEAAGVALRALWDDRAAKLGLTQETAGALLGMNQSATSQYLNSKIPLGLEVCIKWAALLQCDPAQIRPEFEPLFAAVTTARASSSEPFQVQQFVPSYGGLPADVMNAATPRTASRLQKYRSKLEAGTELTPTERQDLASIIKRLEALNAAIK